MTDREPEKMDLRSHDIAEDKRAELLQLFPEIRTEGGKVDFDRLKLALGETVDTGRERYGMAWPGKADCFKTIQQPSMGTLLPCKEESVDFDTTENMIIEGDNLEVLKLLQKSYLGKVKMIYIDPPYNTGNDFIYPDNYTESLQTYLEYTGQVDSEGKKFSTNTEADGRFHSKWMNMMYPRLYLARNLLSDEGMLFISISDEELSNLLTLCKEMFGEENFLATFVWVNEGNIDNQSRIKINHEYVVCLAKNEEKILPSAVIDPNISRTSKLYRDFVENTIVKNGPANPVSGVELPVGFPADFDEGFIEPNEIAWPKLSKKVQVSQKAIKNSVIATSGWSSKDILMKFISNNFKPVLDIKGQETLFFISKTGAIMCRKKRLEEQSHVLTILRGMGTVQNASAALAELQIDFAYPKPTELIKYLCQIGAKKSDIILDFFSGSGTTAHAVLDLNKQDGGNRKFILVQLPEPTGRDDYKTIADITKERVRRVIKKIKEEQAAQHPNAFDADKPKPDLGFKVFKLSESNFKAWNPEIPTGNVDALGKQLEMHIDHIRQGRGREDILYEILLKRGFPLTTKIVKLELAGKTVFSIAEGAMLICLEKELTHEVIKAMADRKPERVVCLDEGFTGNDQLKTNAVQTMKTKGVTTFQTV